MLSPAVSRNSSVVGTFWTSVLATGSLSTSAVHVCCPNIGTDLYFWMEIRNWVPGKPSSRRLCMPTLVTFLVSWSCCGTSHMCIAHWHRPNSQQQLHLMPPVKPWIDGLSATGSTGSHYTPPKLFDLYFAHSTYSLFQLTTMWVAGKTGRRLTMPFPFRRGVQSTEVCGLKNSIRLRPEFQQRSTSAVQNNMQFSPCS